MIFKSKQILYSGSIFLKVFYVIILAFIVWFVFKFFSFSQTQSADDENFKSEFSKNYAIYAINLPDKLDFAGEKVPLEFFDIRESMDREFLINTYWQSQTLLLIKRARRYFPIIEPILKKNGIPEDFKYLAVVESGFTNSVSPSGAKGIWQFLDETAKQYGLVINDEIDERYNIEKATEAACKYFKEAYGNFNNWTLVAASYNVGIGAITQSLKKQKVGEYYDLLLNEETARYVFRAIAVKVIMTHPDKYGFHLRKKDCYFMPPVENVKIDSSITDLAAFALQFSINYKMLKFFNPWLRQNTLTNTDSKTYTLKIPKPGFRDFIYDLGEDAIRSDSTQIPSAEAPVAPGATDSLKTGDPEINSNTIKPLTK